MPIYLIALFVVPYVCFVFCGEGFNPLTKPANPSKRTRWRHGRIMALASLIGVGIALLTAKMMGESSPVAIVAGVVVFLIMAAVFSAKRIADFFWQER